MRGCQVKTRLLFLAFLVAVFIPAAKAQTCTPYPFNFTQVVDTTWSEPTDSNGPTVLYHSVTLSGTTQMAQSCSPTTRHYAKVYNVFNGIGSWFIGAQVCTSCFTSASSTVTANFQQGQNGTASIGSEAWCTAAGRFVSHVISDDWVKVKTVKVHTKTLKTVATWNVESWCTPESSPPDFNPIAVYDTRAEAPADYYEGFTECWRPTSAAAGSPWNCHDLPNAVITQTSQLRVICTKYDAGIGGFSWSWWQYWQQKAIGWVFKFFLH